SRSGGPSRGRRSRVESTRRERRAFPFGPANAFFQRRPRSRGPAAGGGPRSASAAPRKSTPSFFSAVFPTTRPGVIPPCFPAHRGIETITYVLAGTVEHGDSLGNRGALGAGDVQWMTAGRGILHQEMPQGDPQGRMHGFQLWANLPSSLKMTAPRYQDIKA